MGRRRKALQRYIGRVVRSGKKVVVVPDEKPLRSVEDLLRDAQRLCQRQMEHLCQERAGGTLAAVLGPEEMDLLGMLVRTLKTIGDKVPQGEGEDLSKLSSEDLERRMRAK